MILGICELNQSEQIDHLALVHLYFSSAINEMTHVNMFRLFLQYPIYASNN